MTTKLSEIEKYKQLMRYCFSVKCDDCRFFAPDRKCRWDEKNPKSTEECYRFALREGLIEAPDDAEINFIKVERNDEVEQKNDVINRKAILETAEKYVCNDRNNQYGSPEDSFKVIASLWAGYLGTKITAKDVAAMMVLFKMARVRTGAGKADNWIDAAGYCACGGEIENTEVIYADNT